MTPTDTIRAFYDALAKGDALATLSNMAGDIEWIEMPSWPHQPNGRGPEMVARDLLGPLLRDWDKFSAKPLEFFADGNTVTALGVHSGTHKRTAKSFQSNFAHVWNVHDGKITRMRQYTDTYPINQAAQ